MSDQIREEQRFEESLEYPAPIHRSTLLIVAVVWIIIIGALRAVL